MKTNKLYNEVSKKENLTNSNDNNNTKIMENSNKPMSQKQLTEIRNQSSKSIAMKASIMKQDGDRIDIIQEEWKFGLLKQNRPIKESRVIEFTQVIHEGKYDSSQSIVVIKAEEIVGKYEIVDLEGEPIPESEAKYYLVVLDGQHRISAYVRLNATRDQESQLVVPTVYIKTGIKDLGKYLAETNLVGMHWNMSDKVCVAAISTGNKIMKEVNTLIKRGFSGSTAFQICAGKRISNVKLKKMLEDGDTTFLAGLDEDVMVERARKFTTIGLSISGMTIKMLRKRYFSERFSEFARSLSYEQAFEALGKLRLEDFEAIRDECSADFIDSLKRALSA